jgi:hypothetical protein
MTSPEPALRLTRQYRQTLLARPERVFPLLCPEREKQWLPGWNARWIYSASGLAEPGAVFATRGTAGHQTEVIWVVAAHCPPAHVHFVRWHPAAMVVDVRLDLQPAGAGAPPDSTWLDIRYTFTALSPTGGAYIETMTEPQWLQQMTFWEDSLNRWLAANPSPVR